MVIHVHLHRQILGLDVEDVTAVAVVIAQQVQVIAGHIDRAGIAGSPEPHQASAQAALGELRLVTGRGHQVRAMGALAGHAVMNPLKRAGNADSAEEIVTAPKAIELSGEVVPTADGRQRRRAVSRKEGRRPKGSQGRVRGDMHRPITAGLPAGAIEHDPLTIEAIEGAQAEVSMALDVRHAHATLIDPLHQGARGGDLIDRVVVKI